jgi:predicted RNA-binding Zn-ribbon protein involved in translation (DUF1610 family)
MGYRIPLCVTCGREIKEYKKRNKEYCKECLTERTRERSKNWRERLIK